MRKLTLDQDGSLHYDGEVVKCPVRAGYQYCTEDCAWFSEWKQDYCDEDDNSSIKSRQLYVCGDKTIGEKAEQEEEKSPAIEIRKAWGKDQIFHRCVKGIAPYPRVLCSVCPPTVPMDGSVDFNAYEELKRLTDEAISQAEKIARKLEE